jgi:hypothetical protein
LWSNNLIIKHFLKLICIIKILSKHLRKNKFTTSTKMKKSTKKTVSQVLIGLAFMLFYTNSINAQFIHPGITHKLSDLDRMKYMIEAQIDPWYSSYQEMVADSKSSSDYTVQGDESFTELGRDDGTNYSAWNSDIRAAYYNAIRWYVTGESAHAEKAVEIFNAWKNLTSVTSGGTDALSGGVGYIMIEAAELIKNTYDGWSDSDIQAFQDMLVYPGYSTTEEPTGNTTFYWMSYQGDPVRHGNQGLSGWRTVMAMGIFLDNEIMYDRALNYIKGLAHRSDDLAYPSGPNTSDEITSSTDYSDTYSITRGYTEADYGYNEVMTNYIWENGQCQESSRDQQHTAFGIGLLTSMAEMAWNQGDDLYSFEDDRLLLGLEFNMRYNVSYIETYDDQTSSWEPSVSSGEFKEGMDRTGRWYSKAINPDGRGEFSGIRNVFEMPVAHYIGRGLKSDDEVKWTTRARDKAIELSGYEEAGWSNDALGWGALTARRPDYCYGDPISGFDTDGLPEYAMNTISGAIEAENFDYDPISGEDRIYYDKSSGNAGGEYRNDQDVDIEVCDEGGYNLSSIESEEWLTYTIYIPETAYYSISINYASSQTGGKMKFSFGGEDSTSDLDIPFGTPNSTGNTDWQDYTIADNVVINKGVQSLKISFSGVSESFKLNNFTLTKSGTIKEDQTISFFTLPYQVTTSSDLDPGATASSGLELSYSSSNTNVATIVDNKIHIIATGTTTITASQDGDDSYNAAPNATQELNVVNAVSGSVSLDPDADTYVKEAASSTNYGTSTTMVTKAAAQNRYAYLKFDLSTIPGPIVSATLRLYQRTSYEDDRSIYDVADDSWTEEDLTWNNKPTYTNERASAVTNKSTWTEWDISSYAAQEYADDQTITIVVNDPESVSTYGIDFYSKENSSNTPELVIEYYNDLTTTIENESIINADIKVYPNPVKDHFYIDNCNGTTMTLYNSVGSLILNMNITSNHQTIDISSISKGIYFIKIAKDGRYEGEKIIKL